MKKITLNLGDYGQYYKPVEPVKRSYKKTSKGASTKAPKVSSKTSSKKAPRKSASNAKGKSIKTSKPTKTKTAKPKTAKKEKTSRKSRRTPEEIAEARQRRFEAHIEHEAQKQIREMERKAKESEREAREVFREAERAEREWNRLLREAKREERAAAKAEREAKKQFNRDNRDFEKVAKLRAKAILKDEGISGQGRKGTYTTSQLENKIDDLLIKMYDKHLGKLTTKEINDIKNDPEFSKIASLFSDSLNNLRDRDQRNAVMADVLGKRGKDRVISLETKAEVLMKMYDFESDTRIRYEDHNEKDIDKIRKTISKPMLEKIRDRILNSTDVDPVMKEYIKAGDLRTVLAYMNYRAYAKEKSKGIKNYTYNIGDENYAKDQTMAKMYVKSDSLAVSNLLNYQLMYSGSNTESKRILRQAIKSGVIENVDDLKDELKSYN